MKKEATAAVIVQNCTFHGSDSVGVIEVAKALKANAKALEALCNHLSNPQSLLTFIGDKKVE